MTKTAWASFSAVRERYRAYIAELEVSLPQLRTVQQALVDSRVGGSFAVDTSVVFNAALDDVGPEDEIKLILVADNPGRREQAAENRRYLIGPSGKLADGFFRTHPELGIDFRRNVLILNKTPIHTPRTAELKLLARAGGKEIAQAIQDSQRVMVDLIHAFHRALSAGAFSGPHGRRSAVPLWIIGYSELGAGKLFETFSLSLDAAYPQKEETELRESILLFRHFSMNQFSVDLRKRAESGESMGETLTRVGTEYRLRVLGW
jgi:hypothetical protein